jgi:hypothetical protein
VAQAQVFPDKMQPSYDVSCLSNSKIMVDLMNLNLSGTTAA